MELLSDIEVRVLGSLIEKEITTPDNYPLSLNALVNACNQSSNRDPVVHYDDVTVKAAVDRLRKQSLVRSIQGAGERVIKYLHLLADALDLDRAQLAVLDVLMLRRPQTLGEVRTRASRMYEFQRLEDVEGTLDGLATRAPEPLVVRLERQAGQKEARFAHLLSGEPEVAPAQALHVDVVPNSEPALDRLGQLEAVVESLQKEVAQLRAEIAELRRVFD
ncbi:MAG TPA: YceH family protein [Gemmatimonadaceae bacterium]|nr:YceH family protein [Gemmatimonadaceae bacterium]